MGDNQILQNTETNGQCTKTTLSMETWILIFNHPSISLFVSFFHKNDPFHNAPLLSLLAEFHYQKGAVLFF